MASIRRDRPPPYGLAAATGGPPICRRYTSQGENERYEPDEPQPA